MNIREQLEAREQEYLSPLASLSRNSKGRKVKEEECGIRPCYQRDRDRILHSKSFRRLKHKTQVFLDPVGDHYRTRLTHTLEVSQNARTICKALMLNEDLVEAIALGHDLGHPPFGHAGERALNEINEEGFCHNEQSLRIVEVIENEGRGLNLTFEVRDGILNHKTAGRPSTLEGKIIRFSDKIAYIHHDIDDAIRAGVITQDMIPREIRSFLGEDSGTRLDSLMNSIITTSWERNDIAMDEAHLEAMMDLRKFMFEYVYTNPSAKKEESKVKNIIEGLYDYYLVRYHELPEDYIRRAEEGDGCERAVCDYIAGMTDQYAIKKFEEIYVPKSWRY